MPWADFRTSVLRTHLRPTSQSNARLMTNHSVAGQSGTRVSDCFDPKQRNTSQRDIAVNEHKIATLHNFNWRHSH